MTERYHKLKRQFEYQLCRPLSAIERDFIAWIVKRDKQELSPLRDELGNSDTSSSLFEE